MESVLDILNDAKAVYYRSTDRAKLEEKEKRLDGVMKDPYAYEENKRYAQSLKWRITAKRLLLEYQQLLKNMNYTPDQRLAVYEQYPKLLEDRDRLAAMGKQAATLGNRKATDKIIEIILSEINR